VRRREKTYVTPGSSGRLPPLEGKNEVGQTELFKRLKSSRAVVFEQHHLLLQPHAHAWLAGSTVCQVSCCCAQSAGSHVTISKDDADDAWMNEGIVDVREVRVTLGGKETSSFEARERGGPLQSVKFEHFDLPICCSYRHYLTPSAYTQDHGEASRMRTHLEGPARGGGVPGRPAARPGASHGAEARDGPFAQSGLRQARAPPPPCTPPRPPRPCPQTQNPLHTPRPRPPVRLRVRVREREKGMVVPQHERAGTHVGRRKEPARLCPPHNIIYYLRSSVLSLSLKRDFVSYFNFYKYYFIKYPHK
jgi:hypothetical protein